MELLDILERRVDSLVAEIHSLRGENAKLRQAKGSTATTAQENTRLKQALQSERQVQEQVQKRLEKLLSRIKDLAPAKQ